MSDPRCKCSLAISLTGDGCRYCQPQEHIDRLKEWLDEERQQLEQAEARVAELESEVEFISGIGAQLTKAATLRKQAEAVEEFGQELVRETNEHPDIDDGDFCADDLRMMAETHAQRLRQQADELEKDND